ncbi:MAG: isoprenylcysteine carboxylmethyltransferase family protein [Nitrospirae bacterium]|nr:isoprenylcysteine carboxylmethyltransferase family protein [Nitrospirota bacterium]
MPDFIALIIIAVWPVIPLFWIPVHGFPRVFRRLGLFSYVVPAVLWLPLAYVIFKNRHDILSDKFQLPALIRACGAVLFLLGAALQVWTARLLSLRGIMGMPEISDKIEGRFVTSGPFKVVRHPTYLSHTMMFLGLFLTTGLHAMGVVTVLDLLLISVIVIPLEDRELSARFGREYDEYKRNVSGFLPVKRTGKYR